MIFDYIKQSYLVTANSILSTMRQVEGLDDKTAHKVDFYTRQFVDAIAPSNFLTSNPEVLEATLRSGGENLLHGLENLLEDLERGKGRLSIAMTDMKAFRPGENIATTPGKVIYQNELMQLIQYDPATKKVRRTPLLIVPPWINKFYVLDLRPENSFIRWAVAQGHTVFVISWINPDERLSQKSFADYMLQGPLEALDAIEAVTGEHGANLIGYCLGGTLLATTLAYLAAKGEERVKSATYFVSLVDFTEVGDMAVFIDEEQLKALEARMSERGYLQAHDMANSFNMLRANDLIWSFVVNNYLLGKEPVPFDLSVLERRRDPHAGGDALILSAQHVPREPAVEARRHYARGSADRPAPDHDADIHPLDARGPHRALALDLRGDADLWRSSEIRACRLRPHRRDRQPARLEIRALAELRLTKRGGRMVPERHRRQGIMVARVGRVGLGLLRGRAESAQARGSQAEAARSSTRLLCTHSGDRVRAFVTRGWGGPDALQE